MKGTSLSGDVYFESVSRRTRVPVTHSDFPLCPSRSCFLRMCCFDRCDLTTLATGPTRMYGMIWQLSLHSPLNNVRWWLPKVKYFFRMRIGMSRLFECWGVTNVTANKSVRLQNNCLNLHSNAIMYHQYNDDTMLQHYRGDFTCYPSALQLNPSITSPQSASLLSEQAPDPEQSEGIMGSFQNK